MRPFAYDYLATKKEKENMRYECVVIMRHDLFSLNCIFACACLFCIYVNSEQIEKKECILFVRFRINPFLHESFQNGLLSSLPYLGKYVMAVIASALADRLLRTGALTTTQTRKIFTTFATMTPGLLMILQIFFGYDRTWSVIIFTTQLFLNGAVTAGYLGNGLDIAPNFSGTIFGLANTLSSIGGFVSTFMVGALTENNVSVFFSGNVKERDV